MPACLPARVPGLVDEFSKFTFDVTKGLEVQKVSRMGKKRQCVMKLQKQRNGQTVRGASSYPPSISRDRLSLVYTRLSLGDHMGWYARWEERGSSVEYP